MFYLIDCIIKSLGNPYLELFSGHLVSIFNNTYAQVLEHDKLRLDYLLSTWEARGLINTTLLEQMRSTVGPLKVNFESYPQSKNMLHKRSWAEVSVYCIWCRIQLVTWLYMDFDMLLFDDFSILTIDTSGRWAW